MLRTASCQCPCWGFATWVTSSLHIQILWIFSSMLFFFNPCSLTSLQNMGSTGSILCISKRNAGAQCNSEAKRSELTPRERAQRSACSADRSLSSTHRWSDEADEAAGILLIFRLFFRPLTSLATSLSDFWVEESRLATSIRTCITFLLEYAFISTCFWLFGPFLLKGAPATREPSWPRPSHLKDTSA